MASTLLFWTLLYQSLLPHLLCVFFFFSVCTHTHTSSVFVNRVCFILQPFWLLSNSSHPLFIQISQYFHLLARFPRFSNCLSACFGPSCMQLFYIDPGNLSLFFKNASLWSHFFHATSSHSCLLVLLFLGWSFMVTFSDSSPASYFSFNSLLYCGDFSSTLASVSPGSPAQTSLSSLRPMYPVSHETFLTFPSPSTSDMCKMKLLIHSSSPALAHGLVPVSAFGITVR